MDYKELFRTANEEVSERFALASLRIKELADGDTCEKLPKGFADYFEKTASFLVYVMEVENEISFLTIDKNAKERNEKLYQDILKEHYDTSYGNPDYACERLGEQSGLWLSYLYEKVRRIIPFAFRHDHESMTVILEHFIEIYCVLVNLAEDGIFSDEKAAKSMYEPSYYYSADYCEFFYDRHNAEDLEEGHSFSRDIIMEADLGDPSYLYLYGDYVSEDDMKTSAYVASLPQETVALMARTCLDGYYKGFEHAGIDFSKKKLVQVVYHVGFERMARLCVKELTENGHDVVCDRWVHEANKQFNYDHRYDEGLVLDHGLKERKLQAIRSAWEKRHELAASLAGPAVIDIFGQEQFIPVNRIHQTGFSPKQEKLSASITSAMTRIIYEHVVAEERSFTIISFPVPAIGPDFPRIFDETIRLNTLDYGEYREIQQKLIDALDKCKYVVVKGKGVNLTNLQVELWPLENPEKESIFENCLADVNIPLGEVFTSPVLKGTSGLLHVGRVYIDGFKLENLKLTLKDGMITDYSCTNFVDEEACRNLIRDHILFRHDTLPIGEFAIGTNTVAYKMARDFDIFDKLDILIAEKTGPHFAFGDTCYSDVEDMKVYNPDGKECVARDNEITLLRKTEPDKAYFGCHTDITIPYDELGCIYGVTHAGEEILIINDGRFVLDGCEELNKALKD